MGTVLRFQPQMPNSKKPSRRNTFFPNRICLLDLFNNSPVYDLELQDIVLIILFYFICKGVSSLCFSLCQVHAWYLRTKREH